MEDLLQFLSGNIGAALFAAAAGYLLGSINFAIIVTRFTVQQDIRTVGSGNAGTTNVLRAAGKIPAFITLMGDFLKAIAAVIVGKMILMNFGAPELALSARLTFGAYIGAFSCLLGHLFPCYFNFKGGKGVMTTAGMMLMLDWRVFLTELVIFVILLLIFRYVSLSSVTIAVLYPAVTWAFTYFADYRTAAEYGLDHVIVSTVFSALIGIIVLVMHRENIKRLISGTERKLVLKKSGGDKPCQK